MGRNRKVGILTFHASYNCGSMLQTYAMQTYLDKLGYDCEIIDFSTKEQKKLYSLYTKKRTLKYLIRDFIFYCHHNRIENNFKQYELFKTDVFHLSKTSAETKEDICIDEYNCIIAGSDQIWNITIDDFDDVYFLPWDEIKKIAYAPSFGAKNPAEYSDCIEKYIDLMNKFDYLSVREKNGQKWIRELTGRDVPVVLDPTLLIEKEDYASIVSDELSLPEEYIFFYCPSYSISINKMVKKISKKYNLPVIAFNSKPYYLRGMNFDGFKLPDFEDPKAYLQLMKNAEMVITTSFHGTVFSTIYRKKFWVIKNGGMYGNDDRVMTLLSDLAITDRLIELPFDEEFNYMKSVDYSEYEKRLEKLKNKSQTYLKLALENCDERTK